jgi:hypothetical protein
MATEHDYSMALFNVSREAVVPLLSALRLVNSTADALFYDVGVLYRELAADGYAVVTAAQRRERGIEAGASRREAIKTNIVNLGALADPEGVILVIDAHCSPYVTRYADVGDFLKQEAGRDATGKRRKVRTITVTGVGSSALGAAAFGWNVSSALDAPVAAIVSGYGLADILPQALGGWFGFGVANFLRRTGQQWMQLTAPHLAATGRALLRSAPARAGQPAANEPLAFRAGCPESDILHAILREAPGIVRLYGHSKGALCIENALRGLPARRAETIAVTTYGCAIAEETGAAYEQILGSIDGLGQLNSWGNVPERWIDSWHTTNTMLPLPMRVAGLMRKAQDIEPQTRRRRGPKSGRSHGRMSFSAGH